MSKKKHGGPAFPRPVGEANDAGTKGRGLYNNPQTGMTLRDYFAGQFVSAVRFDIAQPKFYGPIAADAYLFADEMLEARDRGGAK